MRFDVLHRKANALLEGPLYDPSRNCLFFSDAHNGGVSQLNLETGDVQVAVPHRRGIGGIAAHADGGLIVTGRNVAHKTPSQGNGDRNDDASPTAVLLDLPASAEHAGFNDLTVDARGRVWVGTVGPYGSRVSPGVGKLLVVDTDLAVHELKSDLVWSNGIAFSPGDELLYHADSGTKQIYRYRIDPEGPEIETTEVFFQVDEGEPDGIAVTEDGRIWIALARAGQLLVLSPAGGIDDRVAIPAELVTSMCFGGSDRKTLFVVSGVEAPQEGEGYVYAAEVDVPGLEPSRAQIPVGRQATKA